MSKMAERRLLRDFRKMQNNPPEGISGAPAENNIFQWSAVIFGPTGTPFEDGTFRLSLTFTEDYPQKPPTVTFVDKVFHPNVYANGSICLDVLNSRWSPAYDVSTLLLSIQSLLDSPNPNSPANAEAAKLFVQSPAEYRKKVASVMADSWLEEGEQSRNTDI